MTAQPQPQSSRPVAPTWLVLVVAVVALMLATAAFTATLLAAAGSWSGIGFGMMGGYGPGVTGGHGPGMMGGRGMMGGGWVPPAGSSAVGPGQPGFIAGTAASPRVVHVWAGPGYVFTPASITVARGETVTFEVTTMGPLVHEFMVGPADAVANDVSGTPEVSGIAMMQTGSLTYTFDGSGPYAFACHAPGHYEAGMRGSITVVG